YAFIDGAYLDGRAPELVARQLCDGGADLIQLRLKGASERELLEIGAKILPITAAADVGLVINDRFEVAWRIGAPFAQLGQEDFFIEDRAQVSALAVFAPPGAVGLPPRVGLSTHAPEQARRAIAAGAPYLGVGPVYATGTKPSARPVGLEYV